MAWGPKGGSQRQPSLCLGGCPESAYIATGSVQEKSEGKTQRRTQQAGGWAGLAVSEESEVAQP